MAILPRLTFDNLSGANRTIGYATTARDTASGVEIAFHGNVIAIFHGSGDVEIPYTGWDSSTTASRIHKVLKDNGITAGYTFRPSKGTSFFVDGTELGPRGGVREKLTEHTEARSFKNEGN